MMKIICSIVQLFLIFSPLYAIDFCFGVKGGLSIHKLQSKYSLDNNPFTINSDYRIGPTILLFGELKNNKIIGQQVSIGYIQAGGTDKYIEIDRLGTEIGIGKNILKLDYLFISYQGKLQYPIGNFAPYILLGLEYEYLINYDEIYITSQNNTNTLENNFRYSELNKSNISPVIGLGVGYKINRFEFHIEFIPLFYLLPFFKHAVTDDSIGAKHTTNGFIINTGITFD